MRLIASISWLSFISLGRALKTVSEILRTDISPSYVAEFENFKNEKKRGFGNLFCCFYGFEFVYSIDES